MAKNTSQAADWRSDRTPVWTARVLAFAAIWALVAWPVHRLLPHLYKVIWLTLDSVNLPANESLFNFAALAVLASAVRHRKRAAMWAVIGLIQAPAVIYGGLLMVAWAAGFNWHELLYAGLTIHLGGAAIPVRLAFSVAVAVGVIWWLLAHRKAFGAPISWRSVWRALGTLAAGLLAAATWAFAWALALGSGGVSVALNAWWAINLALGQGPEEIVTGSGVAGRPELHQAVADAVGPGWVVRTTSVLATLALLAALVVFTRSDRHLPVITPDQELALRRLLLQYGDQDSLGYFNLRHDKSAVFSADGRAAVVGRLVGGILLASADPVGDRSSWADAIGRWIDLARRHGWTPAVVSATARGGRAW
ncbi:MAG: phosphatidylglycerol lysyltransferase domain-containing protein, partial [Bifidobacteriaceae bacterium]|nr:phosphatidylglycerol lysyltransferase domain-containing protein [Bifidobacteriaceae bacterium]